jgi:glycosyltransferase involved in cell wall biosynthesis
VRILAIATNPETAASTRFRVLQWRPYLEQEGFSISLDSFFTPAAAEVIYQPGRRICKVGYFLAGAARRFLNLTRASRIADMIFIHREAFPLGLKLFFKKLEKFYGPIVYDYDDAMFLPQRDGRGILARLEDVKTPKEVMRLSDVVLAGNQFLVDYACQYAERAILFPTCVDTGKFRPLEHSRSSDRCVVGWIGSHSTTKYLQSLLPILEGVSAECQFTFYVVGSPTSLRAPGLKVTQVPWVLEREVEDFQRCDVGVYPLWHDAWARGKCGFKAIQFMACGVPVVAASVGVNREIIQDGVNGFLAASEKEWYEKLSLLIKNPGLRKELGMAGRKTVVERYSVSMNAPKLLRIFQDVCGGRVAYR